MHDLNKSASFNLEFHALVDGVRREKLANGWYPIFSSLERAFTFSCYAALLAMKLSPGAVVHNEATYSMEDEGYVARLSVRLRGWVLERGPVMCSDEEVVGILLNSCGFSLLPFKNHTHVFETECGSCYIMFEDGTALCRPVAGDALKLADAICFTDQIVDGPTLMSDSNWNFSKEPRRHFYPIYVRNEAPKNCRIGTRVKYITTREALDDPNGM